MICIQGSVMVSGEMVQASALIGNEYAWLDEDDYPLVDQLVRLVQSDLPCDPREIEWNVSEEKNASMDGLPPGRPPADDTWAKLASDCIETLLAIRDGRIPAADLIDWLDDRETALINRAAGERHAAILDELDG